MFFNINSGIPQQVSIILLFSYFVQNLSVFKSAALMAIEKINYMMFSSLLVVLSFLLSNSFFLKVYNEIGMAYCVLFSTVIGEAIIWIVFHKIVIKKSLFRSFKIIIFKPLIISLILYFFVKYIISQISNNVLGIIFSLIFPFTIVLLYHLFSIINVKNYIKKGPNLL
jgi:hypothetical protein